MGALTLARSQRSARIVCLSVRLFVCFHLVILIWPLGARQPSSILFGHFEATARNRQADRAEWFARQLAGRSRTGGSSSPGFNRNYELPTLLLLGSRAQFDSSQSQLLSGQVTCNSAACPAHNEDNKSWVIIFIIIGLPNLTN